jgi:hypothetical protein
MWEARELQARRRRHQKAFAHAHNSSAQPQKVALIAVLPLRSEAKVQAGLHSSSTQLSSSTQILFAKLPYSKIATAHFPSRKKLLLPQKTHNPKNNNANPHINKNCVLP